MPTIYIGPQSPYVGRTLFEILCNLKNFGVGRLVTRPSLRKFPEPSFYVIRKAMPLMDEKLMFGKCCVESVFRGIPEKELVDITEETHHPDFELVPKSEEWRYRQGVKENFKPRLLPRDMEFPPVLHEMLLRERRAKGEDVSEMRLPLMYEYHPDMPKGMYRPAEEGERPTEHFALKSKLSPCVLVGIKEI